ncbi:MAG: AAA family ATPase, partial [Sediminibacterium sp.]|nr:AAA family ATPase [Sediminibacterium sp.]
MPTTVKLNTDIEYNNLAHEIIAQSTTSYFITGAAGTGKSFFLKQKLIPQLNAADKKYVVLAPTGVAAQNVEGQTIHKFFGFHAGQITDESERNNYLISEKLKKLLNYKLIQELDIIIIDEISMVRVDIFDTIDKYLKVVKNNEDNFGGVQLIIIGDIFQLPPVVKEDVQTKDEDEEGIKIGDLFKLIYNRELNTYFSIESKVYQNLNLKIALLCINYRQNQDTIFLEDLNKIRLDKMDINELNSKKNNLTTKKYDIVLTATKNAAILYNQKHLNELNVTEVVYIAKKNNKDVQLDFKHDFPFENYLKLKIGAEVMMLKNDQGENPTYFNGTKAKITKLDLDSVEVQIKDKLYTIKIANWQQFNYKLNNQGKIEKYIELEMEQFPVKLAKAITIHKSQGLTFDNIGIDFDNKSAFAHGQLYVAFSRCKTFAGITVLNEIKNNIVNIHIKNYFYNYIDPEQKPSDWDTIYNKELVLKEVVVEYFKMMVKKNIPNSEWRYKNLIDKGAVGFLKYIVSLDGYGFLDKLHAAGIIEYGMENLVNDPRFSILFSDEEKKIASEKLKRYPKNTTQFEIDE